MTPSCAPRLIAHKGRIYGCSVQDPCGCNKGFAARIRAYPGDEEAITVCLLPVKLSTGLPKKSLKHKVMLGDVDEFDPVASRGTSSQTASESYVA